MTFARRRLALAALVAAAGCDFQPDPEPGPTALTPGRFVTVGIEYRQPTGCANTSSECGSSVVFFGSWMHSGEEVYLSRVEGSFTWVGVATGVPVNWPPTDEAHLVRVFDPHLVQTPTAGVTAARLSLGGQMVTEYESPGTPQEVGVVYIDDNGVGRNPPS
jgi:hypothetical protein